MSDQQIGIVPVFRDASMVGSVEIPVDKENPQGSGSPFMSGSPFSHLPSVMPGFHPAFLPPTTTVANYKNENNPRYHHDQNSGRNSSVSSISNPSSPGPSLQGSPRESSGRLPVVKLEEELLPDTEGRFACTICEKKFHEGVVLREHYEKSHTQVLLHCSMNGCNKVFLSRKSRSIHSDNLHKEKSIDAT
ncbi:zinc finger protein basonuclin-2 [Caerostris extrusa]|uniref:Zinc finger protein basonuclin-2 n=1 Tax=Caerostris extrusa TaxID=172846 RepID=A0AAV4MXV6_CAEEX|nr:zinc finger protein basonuclin-2 [Caerostris extrusa]